MFKIIDKRESVGLRFEDLVEGEFFEFEGDICLKTSASITHDNVYNFTTDTADLFFEGNVIVTKLNVELTILP